MFALGPAPRILFACLILVLMTFSASPAAATNPFEEVREYSGNGPPLFASGDDPCTTPSFIGGAVSCSHGGYSMVWIKIADVALLPCAWVEWYSNGVSQGSMVIDPQFTYGAPVTATTDEIQVTIGPTLPEINGSPCTTDTLGFGLKGTVAFRWE